MPKRGVSQAGCGLTSTVCRSPNRSVAEGDARRIRLATCHSAAQNGDLDCTETGAGVPSRRGKARQSSYGPPGGGRFPETGRSRMDTFGQQGVRGHYFDAAAYCARRRRTPYDRTATADPKTSQPDHRRPGLESRDRAWREGRLEEAFASQGDNATQPGPGDTSTSRTLTPPFPKCPEKMKNTYRRRCVGAC